MKVKPVELAQRVEAWQQKLRFLGIGSMQIKCVSLVDETPSGPHANASVSISDDYDKVHFWFTHHFVEGCETEDDLNVVIIHEWLHVAFRDHDKLVRDTVDNWLAPHSRHDFEDRWEHEQEGLIERLAHTISDFVGS